MTHSKSKITMEEIQGFRKFLEARGFKCRDGKGQWQLLQIQSVTGHGWKPFCHNAKGVVNSPSEFDALIQVFKAPVDPAPAVEVIDQPASRDSDLLDDFAIAALQGLLSADKGLYAMPATASIHAYEIAKAMMAERAKHQPK
jgi:hypothetical protein